MNTPNSDNDNNKNANESLQEEFTQDLNISAENEQSKIDRIVKLEREVETTQLVNENYDCNNHNIREGTNHTEDNLLLTNINIISSSRDNPYNTPNNNNNNKDLNNENEIGAREELSNNFSNKSSLEINNYQENELQPKIEDSSSSNDNKHLPKIQNPKLYSSSINQLYLNKSNVSKEIDSINHNNDTNNNNNNNNIIRSVGSNDDSNNLPKTENIKSNLINVKSSSKQSNPDFKQHDELKSTKDLERETNNSIVTSNNKKFNLPNFGFFENTFSDNKNLLNSENQTSLKTQLIISNNLNHNINNRIASPTLTSHHNNINKIHSHNFDLMHQSSFSSTSSSPPPTHYQPITTSVFDSSGLVEARGTFSAAPAGVKSLNRKNEINSDLFSLENILSNTTTTTKTTNRSGLSSETSSGFNVNNNKNINNNAYSSNNNKNNNFNSATMFHPTWDEWKRSHLNEKNNVNNNNLNESISFSKTSSDNFSNKHKTKNESNDNKNTFNTSDSIEKNTTTRSFIEETIRHKNKFNANQEHQQENQQYYHNANKYSVPNTNYQVLGQTSTNQYFHNNTSNKTSNQKSSGMYFNNSTDVYNPPSPIVINDNSDIYSSSKRQEQTHSSKREQQLNQTKKLVTSNLKSTNHSTRHYPVYPFDAQPNRAASPVRLSSIVLAKQPPIEVEVKDFKIEPPPQPEPQQPKKIKTIMSTQKRKESAPNLTGWRTESDSDTEIQNRLLAKASGSIPIEYISIRRDPKPNEKRPEKNKKSITTGTNTSTERGKRIASTNTNQDELPQYNLHVSLDSLFVKSRREASTSTERKNKNAATETEIKQRDACTVTDAEEEPEPPPPPPPPQQYCFRSRKSRYTEWETASTPPEPTYRLEFLTKSPRVVHRRNFQSNQHVHTHERVGCLNDDDNDLSEIFNNNNVMVDDDDRIIFGSSTASAFNHSHHNHHHHHHHEHRSCRRSGSFPNLLVRPVPIIVDNGVQTKRYVKHTHSTTHTPIIQQQTFSSFSPQIGLLPLKTSNGCINSENWNNHFDVFNSKFSEVFGGNHNFVQHIEPKTER
jgi:hypothetical protein